MATDWELGPMGPVYFLYLPTNVIAEGEYGNTAVDRLKEVRVAIDCALNSQEFRIRGRVQIKADIGDLFATEKELIQQVNEEAVSGGRMLTSGQYI